MSEIASFFPLSQFADTSLPLVICLGNFDGVHLGHARLIENTLEIKEKLNKMGRKVNAGALCFDSLPSEYLSGTPTPRLMSVEQKLDTFKRMGLDCAYVFKFSSIMDLSPQEFIRNILRERCNCLGVVCGFNFRFGKNAVGNANLLASYFDKDTAAIVPPVMLDGEIISSSRIRELLLTGNVEKANEMLGRKFSIPHKVVHGKHIGSTLGFPTLNHCFDPHDVIPKHGIYVTETLISGEKHVSVTNIGVRPTVSDTGTITCETHIIGLEGQERDFYGQKANILFHSRIRDERKFDTYEQLSSAIAADIETAINYFKTSPK